MAANSHAVLEPRQLNDADRTILDELARGRASPSYLADQTGIEQTYINQRLRRLDEHGHVENLARGLWELADDPREDDAEAAPDVSELRARLQDALEARDEAQAKADRLKEDLEACRDELAQARSEHAATLDYEQLHDWIDDGLSRLPNDAPGRTRIEDVRARLQEAIGDA